MALPFGTSLPQVRTLSTVPPTTVPLVTHFAFPVASVLASRRGCGQGHRRTEANAPRADSSTQPRSRRVGPRFHDAFSRGNRRRGRHREGRRLLPLLAPADLRGDALHLRPG